MPMETASRLRYVTAVRKPVEIVMMQTPRLTPVSLKSVEMGSMMIAKAVTASLF